MIETWQALRRSVSEREKGRAGTRERK